MTNVSLLLLGQVHTQKQAQIQIEVHKVHLIRPLKVDKADLDIPIIYIMSIK